MEWFVEHFAYWIVLFVVGAIEYHRRMKASGVLRETQSSTPQEENVHGFRVTHRWDHVGPMDPMTSDDERRELWRNVTTIHGALPEWVAFGWTVDHRGAPIDTRNGLWVDLLLDASLLPTGGTVHASSGDLVYETAVAQNPPPSRALVDAAEAFLRERPSVTDRLGAYVEQGPPAAAVAFRILARSGPDHARRLAERHRDTDDVALAAEIEAFELPASRDRIVARVNAGGVPDRPCAVLVGALIDARDGDGLAALDPSRVPLESIVAYLECLRALGRPEAEAAALVFVDMRIELRAALEVIAAVGGRASIERLLRLQEIDADGDGELGLDITIDLVRTRIADEVGPDVRGGVAIAPSTE